MCRWLFSSNNFNLLVFKKLINDNHGNYTKYIIIPTYSIYTSTFIKTLPVNEVYIPDRSNIKVESYVLNLPKPRERHLLWLK